MPSSSKHLKIYKITESKCVYETYLKLFKLTDMLLKMYLSSSTIIISTSYIFFPFAAIMDGVLSEVPVGPEEVLPIATATTEQVSIEPADEKSVDNFSNGENSEDAPAEVENPSEPLIKTESDAPITLNGMDSNTSCSNSSGTSSLLPS